MGRQWRNERPATTRPFGIATCGGPTGNHSRRTGLWMLALAVCACGFPAISSARAAEWGDLRGRFVYGGEAPERAKLELNKDIEFCSQHAPLDESLVVDPQSRGIANVVLWLEVPRGTKLPVHESYAKQARAEVRLKNEGCRFDPHVCVLQTTQTLLIENADPVAHNTAALLRRNSPFNAVTGVGESIGKQVENTERLPVPFSCSIHAWMSGWLVVKDHPYVAVTGKDGSFELRNLPAGEHTFQVWQEKSGYVVEGNRDGRSFEWERGKVTVTIEPGKNDLGTLTLPPGLFE